MASAGSRAESYQGRKVVRWGIVIVLILSAIGCLTAWIMYRMIVTAPPPIPSPDRSMVLVQSITDSKGNPETHMQVAIEIREAGTGRVLFQRQTKASALRKWDTNWMGNDRVTLYSTEVGRLTWERNEQGDWSDLPENGNRVVPPATMSTRGAAGG